MTNKINIEEEKVKAYLRSSLWYLDGQYYYITAVNQITGKETNHTFQQKPGPFVKAIIARAHNVERKEVSIVYL